MRVDSVLSVFLSSLAMAVGSFLFGNLPLVFQLSESNLNHISTFGAGLLLGTSFMIVLPEGVETIYTARISIDQTSKLKSKTSDPIKWIQESSLNRDIGLCLMVGFVFMLLIDQFSNSSGHESAHQPLSISINDFRDGRDGNPAPYFQNGERNTPTLGFIIHAAADGIAMGAAFSEEASGIGWVVFLAILIHKAPSSFGLATFLLAKRYSKVHIMKQIGIFSAAAPISAIVTFFLLGLWDYEDSNLLKYRTGLILLFSAGTFLYVACVHILPEIYLKEMSGHDHHHHGGKNLSFPQLALLICGFFFPIFISLEVFFKERVFVSPLMI